MSVFFLPDFCFFVTWLSKKSAGSPDDSWAFCKFIEGSDVALDNTVEDSGLGASGFALLARVSPAAFALTFLIACSGISTSLTHGKSKHKKNNNNNWKDVNQFI